MPKIRYALDSLKKKDRFKADEVKLPKVNQRHGRPYSIADSEIQGISDVGLLDFNLSHDKSNESLESVEHVQIKRGKNASMAVKPIFSTLHPVDPDHPLGSKKFISILQEGHNTKNSHRKFENLVLTGDSKEFDINLPTQKGDAASNIIKRHPYAIKYGLNTSKNSQTT